MAIEEIATKKNKRVYSSYMCRKCDAKGIEKNKIEKFVLEQLKIYFTDDIKKEL